jgi:hypothetical protein
MKPFGFFVMSLGVVALSGCAGMVPTKPGVMAQVLSVTSPETSAEGDGAANSAGVMVPTPLLPYVQRDAREGARNRVLNDMRAGLVAWDIGAFRQSQALFADAYEQIETLYADNATAKLARSKFQAEAVKDFKGEPYERAMVGYYRGLAEMVLGDWDNARASFRWGEFQDTLAASEEYQGDMALLTFLRGWTDTCTNAKSQAAEEYATAQGIRASLALPAANDNFLMIAETSGAPEKYATGRYKDELRFKAGTIGNIGGVVFRVDKQMVAGGLAEDLFFQASTRGGRPVDAILAGKASFKKGAETTSNVAAAISTTALQVSNYQSMTGNYDGALNAAGIGALGLLASGIASGIAAATKPEADVRTWDSLPDKVYVATARIKELPKEVVATYVNTDGQVASSGTMRAVKVGQCYLAWGRNIPLVSEAWSESAPNAWSMVGAAAAQPTEAAPAAPVKRHNPNIPTF